MLLFTQMIEVIRDISFGELEQEVRQVPMLEPTADGETIYPYIEADIRLEEVRYSDIKPTTLYVLNPNLRQQASLRRQLGRLGYHPLELDGALQLKNGDDETWGLLPPLVEENPEDGVYLLDGIHRNYQERLLGRTSFMALFISNIDTRCPSYAYPNEWDEIVPYEELPTDPALKKRYRPNPKSLYRNFGLLGAGAPRS